MTDIQRETVFRTQELWTRVQELPVNEAGAKTLADVAADPQRAVPEDVRQALLSNPVAQAIVAPKAQGTGPAGDSVSLLQLRAGGAEAVREIKDDVAAQLRDSFKEQGQLELQLTYYEEQGTHPERAARLEERLNVVRSQRAQLKSLDAVLTALSQGLPEASGIEVDANAIRFANHSTLNIGSGNRPMKAAVNLDIIKGEGVDVIADVRDMPFPDAHFEEVRGQKVPSPLLGMMGDEVVPEIFRVLKPGGRVDLQSMTGFGPAMVRPFVEAGFVNIKGEGTQHLTAEKPTA